MARAFSRKGPRIVGKFDDQERQIVVGLLSQVRDLLASDHAPSSGDPLRDLLDGLGRPAPDALEVSERDPALRRLLPDASRDDEQVAGEFRALAETGIRQAKSAHLRTAIGVLSTSGSRVDLDLSQAQSLMIAVGDVRLTLGERLGLRTDEDAERLHAGLTGTGTDDAQALLSAYYDFLTWVQESLALALTD